jgi:hypothetical protein
VSAELQAQSEIALDRGQAHSADPTPSPSYRAPEEPRQAAARARVRRRLDHAHGVARARDGIPPIAIQRQLPHTDGGIAGICLQGVDSTGIIDTVHARRAPRVPVDANAPPPFRVMCLGQE